MRNTESANTGYLPPDDPNYRQYQLASQFEPSPIARQFAATLIGTCPHGLRNDRAACADHLSGVMAAHGLSGLADEGKRRSQPHLAAAEEAKDELIEANDELEAAIRERRSLPDEVVTEPSRATRGDVRRQLSQNQRIAAQRELIGDREHLRTGTPGWVGWVVAVIVAVIETVVTLRIFNVDFTDLSISFLPWLALTVALGFFNHRVAAYLGEKRRAARETLDAATRLNTTAISRLHLENGVTR